MGNLMYAEPPLYGSQEEIGLIDASTDNGGEQIDRIKHPQYIIFGIGTDCSSTIEATKTYLHQPMMMKASTLEIRGFGSYDESFVERFSSDGYDCINKCCDFLLEMKLIDTQQL